MAAEKTCESARDLRALARCCDVARQVRRDDLKQQHGHEPMYYYRSRKYRKKSTLSTLLYFLWLKSNMATYSVDSAVYFERNIVVMDNVERKQDLQEQELAKNAVLVSSSSLSSYTNPVKGYDFNKGIDYHELFSTMASCGFQATNFGQAIEEINQMLHQRSVILMDDELDELEEDEFIKRKYHCTIFLGYTSNMVSSGIRDIIRFLVQHKLVDCLVTTAGGVEEDFIKCMAPTYVGSFYLDDRKLREDGINRTGNLLVPNDNYCLFEDWLMPKLDAMLAEQKRGTSWTPSKMIARLGEEINHEDSIYYWAAKNKIPVFCPALTDGSIGDMMFFHSFKNPGLILDIVADVKRLNRIAMKAVKSGMIIVGGGVVKHHICNANLMRNGADYAVFINTSSEFDGSDSGARPEEAISWGKIRKDADPVKVCADATLVFPLLVGETFARYHHLGKIGK